MSRTGVAVEKLAQQEFAEIASRQEALQTIFPSLLNIFCHPIFDFFQENRLFQQPQGLSLAISERDDSPDRTSREQGDIYGISPLYWRPLITLIAAAKTRRRKLWRRHPVAALRFPQLCVVIRIYTRPSSRYHCPFLYDDANDAIGRSERSAAEYAPHRL
jgi:hypothetical protein